MKQVLSGCLGIGFALVLAACANKKSTQYSGVEGDYVTGTPLPERVEGTNFFSPNVNRSQFEPIYFSYDRFSVSDSELAKIGEVASALRSMKNDIIVAGFTDERGTEEYNRVLGEKRAQAVREALIGYGVNPNRVQTVSFGEEMPADPSGGEAAWAKNRRAEFGVIR